MAMTVSETLKLRAGLVEPGCYPATLLGVELVGGLGDPYVRFVFLLDGGQMAAGRTNLRNTPGCKLFRWASALTGLDYDAGETLDLGSLSGHRALVDIITTDNDGKRYNTVIDVKPIGDDER